MHCNFGHMIKATLYLQAFTASSNVVYHKIKGYHKSQFQQFILATSQTMMLQPFQVLRLNLFLKYLNEECIQYKPINCQVMYINDTTSIFLHSLMKATVLKHYDVW